jgi:hypothetical protein
MSREISGEDLAGESTAHDRKLLLVAGCPRSGTTWLQLLLAQHPAVATCTETYLFVYLNHMHRRWVDERNRTLGPRSVGLSQLLSDDEFYALCRNFAAGVLAKIGQLRPDSRVVLEKTPDNILRWELILKLFPDAHFLHVVRDPRSVASSLVAAGRSGWGAAWAPRSVVAAARRWREAIEAGSRLAKATDRYREVRYESLLSDGPEQLGEIFTWLGLPHDADFRRKIIEACRIDKLRTPSNDRYAPWAVEQEPPEFFRRGEAESWRKDLKPANVKTVEYLLGDLMRDLGYPPAIRGPVRKPVAVRVREVLDALEWRSRRWLERLGA